MVAVGLANQHAQLITTWQSHAQTGALEAAPIHPDFVAPLKAELTGDPARATAILWNGLGAQSIHRLMSLVTEEDTRFVPAAFVPHASRHAIQVFGPERLREPLNAAAFADVPSWNDVKTIPILPEHLKGATAVWEIRIGGRNAYRSIVNSDREGHLSAILQLLRGLQKFHFGENAGVLVAVDGEDLLLRICNPEAVNDVATRKSELAPMYFGDFAAFEDYPAAVDENLWPVSLLNRRASVDGVPNTDPFVAGLHDYYHKKKFEEADLLTQKMAMIQLRAALAVFPDCAQQLGSSLNFRMIWEVEDKRDARQFLHNADVFANCYFVESLGEDRMVHSEVSAFYARIAEGLQALRKAVTDSRGVSYYVKKMFGLPLTDFQKIDLRVVDELIAAAKAKVRDYEERPARIEKIRKAWAETTAT